MAAQLTTLKGEVTGEPLGKGSYGSVVEMKINGKSKMCAGKIIYDILIDIDGSGVGNTVTKYTEECLLMSSLTHFNITQCLGVCRISKYRLPILVMEKLETNLHDFLENVPNISLQLKLSILTDVSNGLLYLHSHDPQVIHRDLTAKNVLLTRTLVAKITDFGNSRLLNLFPQGNQHLTRNPGTPLYMPPEAANSGYGPRLDVFSFGHLALFVLLQVFPSELKDATYPDDANPGGVTGRSEIERRRTYFDMLEQAVPEALVRLVKDCLQNDPPVRPTAEQVVDRLQLLTRETDTRNSKASLLIEKLSLGKHKGKNILVVGKSKTGKKSFVRCLFQRTNVGGGTQTSNVNVNIFTPTNKESYMHLKESADVILLCFRMDDQLGVEDDHVIAQLKRYLGTEFLKRTLILLTMANQVRPVGVHRNEVSHQELLKAMRNDFVDLVLGACLKQKISPSTDSELSDKFFLVGAPELSHDKRMIPDLESHCSDSLIDWVQPLGQALLDRFDSISCTN